MKFIYPQFLFALFSIAVPIIIHLFNFRKYKTIYFSNIQFLKEVKQETQSKSRLKHLLVLLSRILAISFLVLAFAQPFIPSKFNTVLSRNNVIGILIDNSFSMESVGKNGKLIDEAKRKAIEIVRLYKADDRFLLLTNDYEAKHQKAVSKEECIDLIEEVKTTPRIQLLSESMARQQNELNKTNSNGKKLYVISDFQKSTSHLLSLKKDTSIQLVFIPLTTQAEKNISIDSCWFMTPVVRINQIATLRVRIKNYGGDPIENGSVKLFVNDQQKALSSFNVNDQSSTEVELNFSITQTGIQNCRIELEDFPVSFDDKFYFSFEVYKKINVLTINKKNRIENNQSDTSSILFIRNLFSKDSLFNFTTTAENSIDYSTFKENDLLILNELEQISSGLGDEIKRFVSNGGSLLVFPGNNIDLTSYTNILSQINSSGYTARDTNKTKVERINYESIIYKNVFDKKPENIDLPTVISHYKIKQNRKSMREFILQLQNGNSFLERYSYMKGQLFLFASGINRSFGNFSQHSLFVPTLYNIALYSKPSYPLFYTIGKEENIEVPLLSNNGETVYHIQQNEFDFIPESKMVEGRTILYTNDNIGEAGNYRLVLNNIDLRGVSFNYNRLESDLAIYSNNELKSILEKTGLTNSIVVENPSIPISNSIYEAEQGKKLWKLCIIFALLFLLVEIILLRFLKT